MPTKTQTNPVAQTITAWCQAAGISRSAFYLIDPANRPRTVRFGSKERVIEPASDYMDRRAADGIPLTRASPTESKAG